MPCYKCQGEGGDDTRLCPKCNAERRESQKNPFPQPLPTEPAPGFDRSKVLLACCSVCAVCLSLFILCYAPFGPGYGLSKSEQAYRRCVGKLSEGLNASPVKGSSSDPLKEQFRVAAQEMAKGMVQASCEMVRKVCDDDPDGVPCNAAFN